MTGQAKPVRVELPGPIDIPASFAWFLVSGDDGIDRWDGQRLVRTARRPDGTALPFVSTSAGTIEAPSLEVQVDRPADLAAALDAAGASFAIAPPGLGALLTADTKLGALEQRYRGVRPVLQPELFTALVRAISAQQVNLAWACTTRARLARSHGVAHTVCGHEVWSLDPERLAVAAVADLRALQFTTRKAEYIIGVAREVVSGSLSRTQLEGLDDDAVIERLVRLRGIGRWTAEWILVSTLGRPRVVAGDLGVRKAVGLLYACTTVPTEEQTRALTEHWGAAAAVAQQLALYPLLRRPASPVPG